MQASLAGTLHIDDICDSFAIALRDLAVAGNMRERRGALFCSMFALLVGGVLSYFMGSC